jgi:hypothetical protein
VLSRSDALLPLPLPLPHVSDGCAEHLVESFPSVCSDGLCLRHRERAGGAEICRCAAAAAPAVQGAADARKERLLQRLLSLVAILVRGVRLEWRSLRLLDVRVCRRGKIRRRA